MVIAAESIRGSSRPSGVRGILAASQAEIGVSDTPFGAYVEAVKIGNLLFLSGMLPIVGRKPRYVGRVGGALSAEEGRKAAELACLSALSAAKAHLGALDKITGVAKLGVYIATEGDFRDDPKVADGASELLVKVFGDGMLSSRIVLGVASFPPAGVHDLARVFRPVADGGRMARPVSSILPRARNLTAVKFSTTFDTGCSSHSRRIANTREHASRNMACQRTRPVGTHPCGALSTSSAWKGRSASYRRFCGTRRPVPQGSSGETLSPLPRRICRPAKCSMAKEASRFGRKQFSPHAVSSWARCRWEAARAGIARRANRPELFFRQALHKQPGPSPVAVPYLDVHRFPVEVRRLVRAVQAHLQVGVEINQRAEAWQQPLIGTGRVARTFSVISERNPRICSVASVIR
jgi:enamine deaminase RidA (YjgF/YER057c/UK114 family)